MKKRISELESHLKTSNTESHDDTKEKFNDKDTLSLHGAAMGTTTSNDISGTNIDISNLRLELLGFMSKCEDFASHLKHAEQVDVEKSQKQVEIKEENEGKEKDEVISSLFYCLYKRVLSK